jgi:hypothetical protein|nr:hypothetical protein [Kofleriaceae bacterium]
MTTWKTALFLALPLALSFATASPTVASAQVYVEVGPPDTYVATVDPEYFESRPVYFYNDHWYYRDHGRWAYYDREPDYLRGRRTYWHEHNIERRGYVVRGNVHGAYERGGYVHTAPGRTVRAPSHYRYRR